MFTVIGGKFKFQVQDSDLEYLFWQCEKHIALSEKKTPLVNHKIQEAIVLQFFAITSKTETPMASN